MVSVSQTIRIFYGICRMRMSYRVTVLSVGLATSVVFGVGVLQHRPSRGPQPHWRAMDGLMTAAKTLDLKVIRRLLPPRIKSSRQLIIITDGWGCRFCTPFFTKRNDTSLPGLLITDATTAQDRPTANLTIATSRIGLVTEELLAADGGGLLVDFVKGTAVVARGPFGSWSECLEILRSNESAYKVKL